MKRLKPGYALSAAVVLLVAGVLASLYQDRTFREQRGRELMVQGEILAASITAALVFGDSQTVQEHVSALVINPEIAAAGVYDAADHLVASFARRGGGEPLPTSAAGGIKAADPSRLLITVPVTHGGERLGTVYIREMMQPLGRRITGHVPILLLAVMAALLVAFMGTAQRALRDANLQLESRAVALAETNRLLQTEMEERSNAEAALRQSQKMEAVGQLAGGVAHDFNNLLTIIQGNLHLMRKIEAGEEEVMRSFVAAADMAADRAGHLVRRLLAFSRRQPLSPRLVDLNALAAGMKDLIVHSVGDRVRVEWCLNATWKTLCDVNQMENVILNLANNARDAMSDGGTLTIETVDCSLLDGATRAGGGEIARGEYVELLVRDTGLGMSEEVRKRAVEPFFTTKLHGQGTGLGLSTAFAFIRQSDGYLEIESAPGKGTTIRILLPRAHHRESSEAA